MSITAGQLAARLGLSCVGDDSVLIERVAAIQSAVAGALSFVTGPRYLKDLQHTEASAVILPQAMALEAPCTVLVSERPYYSYAEAVALLHPPRRAQAGIHPSAVIDPQAQVHAEAEVAALAVIEAGAQIEAGAMIGPHCHIGQGVKIGGNTRLNANISVAHGCEIGRDCLIQSGAVIGSDGFGYAPSAEGWLHIEQIGRVVIGDRVEIGANTTIDRGAIGDTVIADGVIIDNQVHIAHNVRIGEQTAIAGCVGIAGSATIGARCTIGGAAGIIGHLEIVDNVHITAMSLVTGSITEPGRYSSGAPLEDNRSWRRNSVRYKQLDDMARRIARLEKRLADDQTPENGNE